MVALEYKDEKITYSQLENAVQNFVHDIENVIKKGDRVGIFMNNSIEYVVSYLSVIRAGGIVVPINTLLKSEITKIVKDCNPAYIITTKQYEKKLKTFCDVSLIMADDIHFYDAFVCDFRFFGEADYDDTVMIIYTSGTTGNPKGVTLTRENLENNAFSIIQYLNLTNKDKGLACLPFFYSYGNSILTTHLLIGATLVIPTSSLAYPPTLIKELEEKAITGLAGVPSTFKVLMPHLENAYLNSLRYVTQAGGHMTPETAQELQRHLPLTEIFIMYGQTEASARLTYLPPQDLMLKPGSIGRAIPGVQLKIENGELFAKGRNIMKGYWNNPEDTSKVVDVDGWLHTGDLATVDTDGYYYLIGRKSEMIKSGGHKISPLDIEETLLTFPGIEELAVIGLPDELMGQKVGAVIVGNIDMRQFKKFCHQNLTSFKIPQEIIFRDSLPRTASGKIKRLSLQEEINN